ncbi:hypothetical protein VTN77DRAFT_9658 [Rasamsonia byssochlamydoides]|uniref:uncharacterized protein n=1 Tax=Rasamsonia byssochlamydoides TaxID=89139 RepID=UPI003742A5BB
MSGAEVLAVVSCVAAIISAYNDGSELVKRIKARRLERKQALENRPTKELETSLTLGPVIVQGQYDNDYRRFGERYAQGDHIAREQLKDIIINLQMALLTNLSMSFTRDVEVDFGTLQIASDNSRVDAVMALCQLYQRLAQAEPLRIAPGNPPATNPPTATGYSPLSQSPPEQRLSHVSTLSSTGSFSTLSTSEPAHSHWNRHEQSTPYTHEARRASGDSTLSTRTRSLFSNLRKHRHSTENQFHIPPVTEAAEERNPHRNRLDAGMSTFPDAHQGRPLPNHSPRGYYSPDEVNPWAQTDPEEDPASTIPDRSYASETMEIFDPDGWGSLTPERSTSAQVRTASSIISRHSSHSSTSGTTLPISSGTSMTLYLPCEENNFAGFCKGAWKLQLGLKKAFTIRMRPSGMYDEIPFWRCSKCCYEGPVRGDSSRRSSWKYDGEVRVHEQTGIRYRWVFLAKSHVHMKRIPEKTDGSVGTFGCVFCCAERHGPAPVFGNLASFMEHLLLRHRQMADSDSPGLEALLDRTRCIVGRVADDSEDFDINLP